MSSTKDTLPESEPAKTRKLPGAAVGMLVGCLCWAASGMISGVILMLFLWAFIHFTTDRGYIPYHATFLGDVWFIAKWAGLAFAVPGVVAGAAIGARIGRRDGPGGPKFCTILKWTWNVYGAVLSAVAQVMVKGPPPAFLDPRHAAETDLESTSKWAAWSALFVFILGLFALLCLWMPARYLLSAAEVVGTVSPHGGVEYVTPTGVTKFTQAEHTGTRAGDKVRVRAHFEKGYEENWVQVLGPGETPDEWHRMRYIGLGLFCVFALLFGSPAVFFFYKAVWRKQPAAAGENTTDRHSTSATGPRC